MKVLLLMVCILCASFAKYDAGYALDMVYASGLSYWPAAKMLARNWGKATQLTEKLGMTVLHAKDNNEVKNSITYGIFKRDSKKEIIVGFSGTRNTEQLITEILEAFDVGYSIHSEQKDAKVFDYFYKHYVNYFRTDFIAKIKSLLATYPSYDIAFTGHSLGGALTVHAAADFVLSGLAGKRQVRVYTFGQPRVGNPAFIDPVKAKTSDWYRLVHNNDIVAHIPPCLPAGSGKCLHSGPLPFYPYHAAEEIYYDEPFTSYKACSLTDGEDASCSNGKIHDSVPDHLRYFNIEIGGLALLPMDTEEQIHNILESV